MPTPTSLSLVRRLSQEGVSLLAGEARASAAGVTAAEAPAELALSSRVAKESSVVVTKLSSLRLSPGASGRP